MYEIELVPLCIFTAEVSQIFPIGRGLYGTRGVGELTNGRLEGERLKASQLGAAAADWGLVSDDGFVRGDIRMTWKTDDGAAIYMQYIAFLDVGSSAYSTPEFETGDERYAWLNRTRIVGKGSFNSEANLVEYHLYEMH